MKFINSDPEKGGVGSWPVPDEAFFEMARTLNYASEPSTTVRVNGAAIMYYYATLITWPRWRREQVIREIRAAMKEKK